MRLRAPRPHPPERRRRRCASLHAGLGDILSTAFELYQVNAAKLIQIVAIVVVPLALIQALLLSVAVQAERRRGPSNTFRT